MVWPIDDLTSAHLDAGTDDPKQARPELLAHINKFKTILGDPAITEVATIAALKALAIPTSAIAVNVQGYTARGDGGGGLFWWDSASSATGNGGTIITPDSSPASGRWIRLYSGVISAKWFGAKGDNVANDTSALQAALNAGAWVYLPKGTYRCTGLSTGACKCLMGDGGLTTILKNTSASGTILTMNTDIVQVEGIGFLGTGGKTDVGIQISANNARARSCYFDQLGKGIQQNGAYNEYNIMDSDFALCDFALYNYGGGINGKLHNCRIASCDTAAYVSDVGAGNTTEGVSLEHCLIYACGDHAANRAVIELDSSDYFRLINCMVDGNNAWVLRALNSKRMDIQSSYIANNFAPINISAVFLDGNCSFSNFCGCRIEFSPYFGLQINGKSTDFSTGVAVSGCEFANNNSAGSGGDILIDSSLDTRIAVCGLNTTGSISVALNATHRAGKAVINNSRLASLPTVGSGACEIKGSDNTGFVLESAGIQVIPNGSTSVTFAHGLNVLTGRQVIVTATNAQDFKSIRASVSGGNITLTNDSATGDTTCFWRARVV